MKVDIEKTIEYYNSLTAESLCQCKYCRKYYKLVKESYPQIAEYLQSYGADIEQPYETGLPVEDSAAGQLKFPFCQYILFGTCEEEFQGTIGNIAFGKAVSYPAPDFEMAEDYFVMEFYDVIIKTDDACFRDQE